MSASPGHSLSTLIILIALHTTVLSAAITVEGYLQAVKGFRFQQELVIPASEHRAIIYPLSAEVLEDYGLVSYSRWLASRSADGEDVPIELEAFEMKNSLGAFGAYSIWPLATASESEWERLSLPVDNSYRKDEFLFWRGNFLFHLKVRASLAESKPRLLELATALVDAIPLLNLHPLTLVHLPRKELKRDSIRFYLGEASLGLDHRLPSMLISRIGFEKDAEVIRAEYGPNGHALFLLGYPTPGVALEYLTKLQKGLKAYFSPQGIYMKRAGVLLGIFLGPEEKARQVLEQVKYTPTVRWIYKKEVDPDEMRRATLGFLEAVRGTFLMVGFFLAVTLGTGVAVGLIRYQVFRIFPGLLRRDDIIFVEFDGPSS